jgi:aminomethyltransferase
MDLPGIGAEDTLAHFQKFLPPRLARLEDESDAWVMLTVLGPEAPRLLTPTLDLAETGFGPGDFGQIREGEEVEFSASAYGSFRLARNGEVNGQGWDLVLPTGKGMALRDALEKGGAVPLTETTLEILRVERGRPAFGRDMDNEILPMEAGIDSRAIDHGKGCYIGQEVVIRVRDRGHVNKELRGFLLGDAAVPRSGTELFQPDREKSSGWITTAVASPAMGEVIALGYARRGVEPGMILRVGSQDGPEAQVRGLGEAGWILD